MEGCVEGDSDGDEDGGEEDEDVPARLGHAVVTEHPLGALRHRRLVLGQRLDVGGRRAQQRLQARKKVFLSLNLMGLRKTCQYRVTMVVSDYILLTLCLKFHSVAQLHCKVSVLIQRLSYPTDTVLSNKITRNRIVHRRL